MNLGRGWTSIWACVREEHENVCLDDIILTYVVEVFNEGEKEFLWLW